MKLICAVLTLSLGLVTSSALATQYNVNRSFTDGLSTADLTGTLDIPVGNYIIENADPSPFTALNLTLTVDATSYNLTNALTDIINGSGQFLIDATPTTLTFSTANVDAFNAADLVFSDTIFPFANNRYVIGYNGHPGFEVAYTDAGAVIADVTFPIVFGTAVPEPSAALLLGLGLLGLGLLRRHS